MDINTLWIVLCAFLVFIMQGGFLALETGMTRTKNNIDVAMKNIVDFTISSVIFWLIGFPIMFGLSYYGGLRLLPDFANDSNILTMFIFQVMFCGTTVTILSGAIAERTRFGAYVVITILLAALVYPVFGQWVWALSASGDRVGWLAQMGFYDFAGSTVVHSVGGWAALALVVIVGARSGRFDETGNPVEIPKSNLPFVVLGILLLWFGWFGFNGGSSFTFDQATLSVLFNTMMGGSIGGMTGYILGLFINKRVEIDTILNGVLAGLVAITAGANVLNGFGIILTAAGGAVVYLLVTKLLEQLKLDDVVGAIPVHLGAGIWGTLAVGLFGNLTLIDSGLDRLSQVLVQLVGILVCGIWTYAMVYGVMSLVNRVFRLRVTAENEQIGLNIAEHGARSDLVDLLDTMEKQSTTRDMTIRAPVEPFTQLGSVANYYNRVIDSLEDAQAALELSNEDLEYRVDEISKANKKLSTANDQIKSFANILSHDLRTPITSVRALVDEIQYELNDIEAIITQSPDVSETTREAVEDFIPESLQMISAAIQQMDSLTSQILIVAKEESRPYQPTMLDMQALVQQIIDGQTGIIREKGIVVKLGALPEICADQVMMQQVFANLISNAVKYLDPTRQGEIIISAIDKPNETVFSIQDNGLGIPESQADRVFQLFRRVGKHSKIEGNGFGLFYIQGMLQRVDADIWFESEEGVGTIFYVSMPKESTLMLER